MLVDSMQSTSPPGGDFSVYRTAHRTRLRTLSTALEKKLRSLTLFNGYVTVFSSLTVFLSFFMFSLLWLNTLFGTPRSRRGESKGFLQTGSR